LILHLDATHIGAGAGVAGVLTPASRVAELLVPASCVLAGGVAGVVTTGVLVLVLDVLGTLAALLLWLTLLGLAGAGCAGAGWTAAG